MTETGLELLILLPLPPKCWNYRPVPPHPAACLHVLMIVSLLRMMLCFFLMRDQLISVVAIYIYIFPFFSSSEFPLCLICLVFFYLLYLVVYWGSWLSRLLTIKFGKLQFQNALPHLFSLFWNFSLSFY